MTDDNKIEEEPAGQKHQERRAYEAPAVRDFFQPLVVLGSVAPTGPGICATPKRPKT